MSGGDSTQVNTEELIQLANGHEQLVEVLTSGTGPPQIKVLEDFPDMAAAQAALGAQRAAKAAQAAGLASTATNLRASADGYGQQEASSQAGLGKGPLREAVKLGELGQFTGAFLGPLGQLGGQFVTASTSMVTTAEQGLVNPLTGAVGAITSAGINTNHTDHKPPDTGAASGLLGPHPGDDPPDHPGSLHQTTPIHPAQHQGR